MNKCLLLILLISLSGCASKGITTSENVRFQYEEERKFYVKKVPEIGVTVNVQVGNSIISSYDIDEIKGIQLLEKINHKGLYRSHEQIYVVYPKDYPMTGIDSGGVFYGMPKGLRTIIPSASVNKFETGGIYIPNESSKNHSLFMNARPFIAVIEPLNKKIKYKNIIITKTSDSGFKKELLYAGKNGSSIILEYREFKDNMARPAFSQTLTYDVSEDKIIGFKEALFEVEEATNAFIKIKVIKHL